MHSSVHIHMVEIIKSISTFAPAKFVKPAQLYTLHVLAFIVPSPLSPLPLPRSSFKSLPHCPCLPTSSAPEFLDLESLKMASHLSPFSFLSTSSWLVRLIVSRSSSSAGTRTVINNQCKVVVTMGMANGHDFIDQAYPKISKISKISKVTPKFDNPSLH